MPFTPFHVGPGLLFKSIGRQYFSLTVFSFAQVMIDIEPLVRLLRGDAVVHGLSHTYPGALVLGIISLVAGKPVCEWGLGLIRAYGRRQPALEPIRMTWCAATAGAFVGTFSHVALDSVMHADMQPLWPWSTRNDLLGLVSIDHLHVLCAFAGLVGLLILLAVAGWHRWQPRTW